MKKINKKGFTLIELLAVIVILAVIALIVTPIVTGIISNAKESANARSVEGHISDVNYAIMSKTMLQGNSNAYDGTITKDSTTAIGATTSGAIWTIITDAVKDQNSADSIQCTTYVISNGNVTSAVGCDDTKTSWGSGNTYAFKQGANAKKATTTTGM